MRKGSRRASRFRQEPLAKRMEKAREALQGLANLTGKAVLDPSKRDPFEPKKDGE